LILLRSQAPSFFRDASQFSFTQLLARPLFLLIDGFVQPVEEPAPFLGVARLPHV
jgi:hypothetical protein